MKSSHRQTTPRGKGGEQVGGGAACGGFIINDHNVACGAENIARIITYARLMDEMRRGVRVVLGERKRHWPTSAPPRAIEINPLSTGL
jgi:hypothetical protein